MDEIIKQPISSGKLAFSIWFATVLIVDAGLFVVISFSTGAEAFEAVPLCLFFSFLLAVPAWICLALITYKLEGLQITAKQKITYLHAGIFFIGLLYGLSALLFNDSWLQAMPYTAAITAVLYAAGFIACLFNRKLIREFATLEEFYNNNISSQNNSIMYENPHKNMQETTSSVLPVSNKILIKSIITAALILLMLIPMAFVQSLITERQERQQQVVEEVSSKWALPQTVSAPYLVIPYTEGKVKPEKKQLIILPDQLNVKGKITEENRPRSIYKVLLYKSNLSFDGIFHTAVSLPDSATLIPEGAKLCFGVSDFRGIENKIAIVFNNGSYTLQPGLPTNIIDNTGLSVSVAVTKADIEKGITFSMGLPLRGSGNLHFLPLGSNSNFSIQSAWPDPSFDGKTLPTERSISGNGFDASWVFNAANLPFTSVIADNKNVNTKDIEFGVSLVQPADQYLKSMRSAKYAILIIGLTFAVFFIFELLQKKPVHPVQYLLIGMALVIFYTLLVSISEIILFEYAYLIAGAATILLISLYAKSHFKTTRSAVIFGLLLSGLYGFIYVLISLEDTALLVGSIALFIVVAIIMYATRKVNWYQPEHPQPVINIQA